MQEVLTKKDIIKIIELIRVNYSEAYSSYQDEETKTLARFWYDSLVDYPRDIVFKAVYNVIKTSEFVPKISTILNEINRILNVNKPTDEELWAELGAVTGKVYEISRYLSYPQYFKWAQQKLLEIYDGLDDELKLYVVNVSTLVELSELTQDSLVYERARFFKQMPILRKHSSDKATAQSFLENVKVTKALPSDKKKS